jgi:hypothetical protein
VPVSGPRSRTRPALTAHGLPGIPRPFAGLAAAADNSLVVSADAEGSVLRLVPAEAA